MKKIKQEKLINKLIITAIAILILSISNINGKTKKSIYLGIRQSKTVEGFYEEGEPDINIFPLIFETSISQRANLRAALMY